MRYLAILFTMFTLAACIPDMPSSPEPFTQPELEPVYTIESSEAKADTCVYDTFGEQTHMREVCLSLGGTFRGHKPTPNSISTGVCKLPFPGVSHFEFELRHPAQQEGCLHPR